MPGKLFDKENLNLTEIELIPFCYSSPEVLKLDPKEDRRLLEAIARYGQGTLKKAALKRLGIKESSEEETADGFRDELYFILQEQIQRVRSISVLKEAIRSGSLMHALFAFCRLSGCSFPSLDNDALSHRTYACGCFEEQSDVQRLMNFRDYSPLIRKYASPKTARMKLHRPWLVQEFRVNNPLNLLSDSALQSWIVQKGAQLGEKGKFVIRFSDCENRIFVFLAAESRELRQAVLDDFTAELKRLGYQ